MASLAPSASAMKTLVAEAGIESEILHALGDVVEHEFWGRARRCN